LSFVRGLRIAVHSLIRTPGLAIAVILTLALGIGANATIFTLVRGVLLKPLVNRDEDRLIYIRQSAPGIRDENATFSVPEIQDLRASVKTLSAFGDFSSMDFTMIGLGEPRSIRGGVVGGTYFDVMGLHPVLGRLIGPQDDGPKGAGVVVLTYRFWTTALHKDPSVIGKTVRLGSIGDRSATIIGVLEPCVPYPQDTEIIANVVTSPHHLSATMVTGRIHRMTELFGRLAPGATLDQARAELRSVYSAMKKDHPEAYAQEADFQIGAKLLRDEITSGARTVLLVLLAASGLVFIIACSNVAAVILAFVPRLPSSGTPNGLSLASGSLRITGSTSRRQRIFAVTQIAASFVLLAGASMLIATLIALQRAQTGLDTQHVLAIDVPAMSYGKTPQQVVYFYQEAIRHIDALPGVSKTAFGNVVPWRDGGPSPGLQFSADGRVHAAGVEDPRAQWRVISPGFFAALGVPIIAGRDFNALDGQNNGEPFVIVSETLAQRMFPNQDAVNRHVYWTDPVLQFFPGTDLERSRLVAPHRVIGITADT